MQIIIKQILKFLSLKRQYIPFLDSDTSLKKGGGKQNKKWIKKKKNINHKSRLKDHIIERKMSHYHRNNGHFTEHGPPFFLYIFLFFINSKFSSCRTFGENFLLTWYMSQFYYIFFGLWHLLDGLMLCSASTLCSSLISSYPFMYMEGRTFLYFIVFSWKQCRIFA